MGGARANWPYGVRVYEPGSGGARVRSGLAGAALGSSRLLRDSRCSGGCDAARLSQRSPRGRKLGWRCWELGGLLPGSPPRLPLLLGRPRPGDALRPTPSKRSVPQTGLPPHCSVLQGTPPSTQLVEPAGNLRAELEPRLHFFTLMRPKSQTGTPSSFISSHSWTPESQTGTPPSFIFSLS